jgi:3-(3-hydroxy-phenyl)propionate hydroxylase
MSTATEAFHFAPAYQLPHWPFVPPPELGGDALVRHPIVIVGAGPAGLTLACDLAQRGVPAVLLDEDDTVGVRGASSRGICYAQKSLEIFERLGIYQRIADKGITWSFGRTFSGETEVYNFNLQASCVSAQPPCIEPGEQGVRVEIETPAGAYAIDAGYLIDASGANSPIRAQLGLDAHVSRSTDRWCISDVRFKKPLPVERWTWVDAPFNEGRAVWQHLMADGVWRIDYQMPEDCDAAYISKPEVAGARLREQLGPGVEFEFVWIGPYGYRDHLLDRFRHGRLFFIGDSAHVVSPFGARGGNSGIQDAANLGWKLALVAQGRAGDALLDTYDAERRPAAAENLKVTSRTARFLAPRSQAEHTMRRAVLALASRYPFARALVNTGRMSVANDYPAGRHLLKGGRSVQNLPLRWRDGRPCTLMQMLAEGTRCLGLWFAPSREQVRAAADTVASLPLQLVAIGGDSGLPTLEPDDALAMQLGDQAPGSFCLLRPDAYRATLLQDPTPAAIAAAVHTVLAHG